MSLVFILCLNLGQFFGLPNPLIPTNTSVHGADHAGSVDYSSSESTSLQFGMWKEVDGD